MIIKISVNHRLIHSMYNVRRCKSIRTVTDLGNRMKEFNDKKQYQQVLQLFDKNKDQDISKFSSMIITQILKACAQMGDLQRGSIISNVVRHRIKNDSYILASLIHWNSK